VPADSWCSEWFQGELEECFDFSWDNLICDGPLDGPRMGFSALGYLLVIFFLAGSMAPGLSEQDQGSGGWSTGFSHVSLSFDRGKILLTKGVEVGVRLSIDGKSDWVVCDVIVPSIISC